MTYSTNVAKDLANSNIHTTDFKEVVLLLFNRYKQRINDESPISVVSNG